VNRLVFLEHVWRYLHEDCPHGLTPKQLDELDDETAIRLWADDPRFTLGEIWAAVDEAKTMEGVNARLDSTLPESYFCGGNWRAIDDEAAA
jgi:hypothetical protein